MVTEEEVYEVLRECYDPEIPVNVLDLGLVYGVSIQDDVVLITMTLTAPGCSMGGMIRATSRTNCWGCRTAVTPASRSSGIRRDPAQNERGGQKAPQNRLIAIAPRAGC